MHSSFFDHEPVCPITLLFSIHAGRIYSPKPMGSIYTSCKRPLFLLILVALSLRLGFVLTVPNDLIWDDSQDYHQVAVNILAGNGPQLHDNAVAFRPPGYPCFLAAIYKLSGHDNLLPARMVQALMSALAVWQVFAIAARVFNRQAGLLAALPVTIDPFQVYFSGMILNETLFISILLLMSYGVLRMRDDWRWVILAGVGAGVGSLVKPSLWYLSLFLLPFLVVTMPHRPRAIGLVAATFIIQLAVASPWLIRNQLRLGSPALTTMSGASLYEALGKGATGGPAMSVVEWPTIPEGLGEADRDAFVKTAAITHARENPGKTLRLSVRKFSRFWSPILNFKAYRNWKYNLVSAGWYLPVMALFLAATWRHRREWRDWLWLLAPVFYFTFLHSIFVGSVRYRIPVMPLLCCVAGAVFLTRPGRAPAIPPPASVLRPDATLSVLIPFLNEARTLPRVVNELLRLPLTLEIILVNDGSTDGSREIADSLAREHPYIKALHHEQNRGKGAAIRTGLAAVTGDVVVIQDADLEYNPEDLVALWEPIARGEASVMYGSRTLGSSKHSYASFYWGGQVVGWVSNLLYDSRLTDEPTCYKMIRADILKRMPLNCTGFEFCPEVTARILREGIPIRELPIDYRPRSFAEGKKIKWSDGIDAIWTLVRYRLAD